MKMKSKSSYKNSHAEENSASNLMLGENAVILGGVYPKPWTNKLKTSFLFVKI